MVYSRYLNVSIVLMMSICCTLSFPSLSSAQNVTLSVSDGAGVRGSFCCNPNYPESNRVEVGLDNPTKKVGFVQLDICSADLGGHLVLSGYEVTPRAAHLNHTISYNATSHCIQVRFFWTQPYGTVYIAEGSGPIAILNFDVSQFAPSGNCPAGGDLPMSAVAVRDESFNALTVTQDPGEFCYYNCGSDLHCDDGFFCNGEETCFNNAWCMDSFFGDPCPPLLCNDTTDTCYCTTNGQCDDGLFCNGVETCTVGTGKCKVTASCASDGDACTDNCDESTDTCPYECNAEGPWDACCASSAACGGEPVCNEEVTITVGNGSGARSSTGRPVIVSLANPSDQVRAVQVEICDGDNYLTIQQNCTASTRVPVGEYTCQCNEQPSGCATCTLSANLPSSPNILTGTGALFTVKYNVSGSAPFGQCRDLTVNTEETLSVLTKVCSQGSSNPGAYCVFDANCPGGTCSFTSLITMPVDGEFCFPCTTDAGCNDGNQCTTDRCVSNLCTYTNLTGSCNDGNSCTGSDTCKKPDIGTKNQCVGADICPDDGDYCSGVEYCSGGVCDDTGNPCASSCDVGNDVCVGSDVTLEVENAYGRDSVIAIALENDLDEVSEVHVEVCDADQRSWLHISPESCSISSRTAGFDCITTDLGAGCVGVDIISTFALDFIATGTGAIAYLNYTVDPVTVPMGNYADIVPQAPDVQDRAAAPLLVTPKPGRLYPAELCESDFNCNLSVDAGDVADFLADFGRSFFGHPCTNGDPCNGDFNCDGNVVADDVQKFLEDFGRNQFTQPCPPCTPGPWCVYP